MKKMTIIGITVGLIGGIFIKCKKIRNKIDEETARKIKAMDEGRM